MCFTPEDVHVLPPVKSASVPSNQRCRTPLHVNRDEDSKSQINSLTDCQNMHSAALLEFTGPLIRFLSC